MFGIYKKQDTVTSIVEQIKVLRNELNGNVVRLNNEKNECSKDSIEADYVYSADVEIAQNVLDNAILIARNIYNDSVAIAKTDKEERLEEIAIQFSKIDDALIEAELVK